MLLWIALCDMLYNSDEIAYQTTCRTHIRISDHAKILVNSNSIGLFLGLFRYGIF